MQISTHLVIWSVENISRKATDRPNLPKRNRHTAPTTPRAEPSTPHRFVRQNMKPTASSITPRRRAALCLFALAATSPTCMAAQHRPFGVRSSLSLPSTSTPESSSSVSNPHRECRYNITRRKGDLISRQVVLRIRCGGADGSSDGGVEGEDASAFDDESNTGEDAPALEPTVNMSVMNESFSDNESVQTLVGDYTDADVTTPVDASGEGSDEESPIANESEPSEDDVEELETSESISDPSQVDEGASSIPSDIIEQQTQLRSSASERRAEGKTLHDEGNLKDAAVAFSEAASLLDEALSMTLEYGKSTSSEDEEAIVVERATCRLHEALCLFKDDRPGDSIEACTEVLEDGVTVVPLDDTEGNADEGAGDDGGTKNPRPTAVVKIVPATTTPTPTSRAIPSQIRARAHHRRAKARLALGDLDGALEDARSAAFMGDRNAVSFYGRLMREGTGANIKEGSNAGALGSWGDSMGGSTSSNPFLEGMLGGLSGNYPLMSSGAGSGDFSSSLLSSLLSNGSSGSGGSPLGILGDLLSPESDESTGKRRRKGKKKKRGIDSLAQSVLTNLMKRMEDEETQESICRYLHSTNTHQIIQFSAMAGIPMREENAQRLVTLANGVTPKGISKNISRVKRGMKIFKTGRKILKVIDKYKPVIIVAVLLHWIRKAYNDPALSYHSKKQAKKVAQKVAKALVL